MIIAKPAAHRSPLPPPAGRVDIVKRSAVCRVYLLFRYAQPISSARVNQSERCDKTTRLSVSRDAEAPRGDCSSRTETDDDSSVIDGRLLVVQTARCTQLFKKNYVRNQLHGLECV